MGDNKNKGIGPCICHICKKEDSELYLECNNCHFCHEGYMKRAEVCSKFTPKKNRVEYKMGELK